MHGSWRAWALAGLVGSGLVGPAQSARAEAAGPELIFSSPRTGSMQLYALGSAEPLVRQLTQGAGDSDSAVWSPDGQRIAFVSTRTGTPQVFVMNADGTGQRRISGDSDINRNPVWSADGASLAYGSARTGGHGIYRYDFATGAEARLSQHEDGPADLAWSPDGARIAFTASVGNRESAVFLLDVKSGKVSPISRLGAGSDLQPLWSPDGRHLLYVKSAGRSGVNLILADADGTNARALTQGVRTSGSPVWAPDSRRIAFASNMLSGERMDVFVLDIGGGPHVNVSAHPHEDYDPAWAPDGRSVYFVSFRSGVSQLYRASLEGDVQRVSRSAQYEGRPLPRPAAARALAQEPAAHPGVQQQPPDRSTYAAAARPWRKE